MFAGFDGIHGLPRNIELDGEFGLAPFTLGPQDAEAVLHLIIASIIRLAKSFRNGAGCQVVLTICRDSLTMSTLPDIVS